MNTSSNGVAASSQSPTFGNPALAPIYSPRAPDSLFSLFLPLRTFSETAAGLAKHITGGAGSDIRAALLNGALIVMVRTRQWEPSETMELVYAESSDPKKPGFDTPTEKTAPDPSTTLPKACISVAPDMPSVYREVDTEDLRDLGARAHISTQRPPPGYTFAVPLAQPYTERIIESFIQPATPKHLDIRDIPDAASVILSIVQIVMGAFTLYFARGDGGQTARWGYAAYGLSVFPYMLMSAINILYIAIVGEFRDIHILRTPILEEAEQRAEANFAGTIGFFKEDEKRIETCSPGNGNYTAMKMCVRTEGNSRTLVVEGKDGEMKNYDLISQADAEDDATHFTVSALSHNGPFTKRGRDSSLVMGNRLMVYDLFWTIPLILTYTFIYALTKFHPQRSTTAQRAWMMAWLSVDNFSMVLGAFQIVAPPLPEDMQTAGLFYLILFTVPAIGGFVTVGQMFVQDTACTS